MQEEKHVQKPERKALKEATAKILEGYSIHAGQDIERMVKEELAAEYESLRAGIMEPYGLDWDALDALVDEVLEM